MAKPTNDVVAQIPHDDLAERAILRAAIVQGDIQPLVQVRNLLYSSRHVTIADAIIAIANAGGSLDVVPIRAELERRGALEQVGGARYLAQLIDEVPPCTNVGGYIDVIQELAWRHAVLTRSQGLIDAIASRDAVRDVVELLEGLADERPAGRPHVEPIDLYSSEVTPAAPRWFVEHLFPRPGLVLVWAVPSGGKTFLLLRIAHELLFVAGQNLLLGHPNLRVVSRPQRVLWIATEETAERLRYRADMVLRGLDVSAQANQLQHVFAPAVKPPITLDDLPTLLKASPAELVVLDSLTGLRPKRIDGQSVAWDRDNDAANTMCLMLRALAVEHDTTIVLVHHTGRDTKRGYRGPTDWWASADVMFGIKPGASPGTVQVQPEKCRDGRLLPPFNLELSWSMDRFSVDFGGTEAKKQLTGKAKEVLEFIRARNRVTQARIFAEVDGARSTLQGAIKKVTLGGFAYFTGDEERRSPVIAYRDEEDDDEVPEVTDGLNNDAK